MARVLVLLALGALIALTVRAVAARKARRPPPASAAARALPSVQCTRCGVYLPADQARQGAGGPWCSTRCQTGP